MGLRVVIELVGMNKQSGGTHRHGIKVKTIGVYQDETYNRATSQWSDRF
jgi:hypothetical protein